VRASHGQQASNSHVRHRCKHIMIKAIITNTHMFVYKTDSSAASHTPRQRTTYKKVPDGSPNSATKP
jgi:hypothetical protein